MADMAPYEVAEYDRLTENAEQMHLDLRPVKTYGYARVSRPSQSLDRQLTNLREVHPDIIIFAEKYTGRTEDRPEWQRLQKVIDADIRAGEAVILCFDSVSRMSRDASAGVQRYFELYQKGVELEFLNEPYINSSLYKKALETHLERPDGAVGHIIDGINLYLHDVAAEQIRVAFDQAEKEVSDLRKRTSQGIREKRAEDVAGGGDGAWGAPKGVPHVVAKKAEQMKLIAKHSRTFGGSLTDSECIRLIGIAPNTYYKYKRELKGSQ